MINYKKCIKRCMDKYGLSKERATYIATTENALLSLEELRYKYDDMQMGGGYPDWITPEEHLKMCYSTVWKKYYGSEKLSKNFYEIDDVVMDLYLHSLIHIHSYKDKYQLYGLLLCKMRNLIRDKTREVSCYWETYDWEVEKSYKDNSYISSNKYNKAIKYEYITGELDRVDLISTVSSIRNQRVKGILLLCGYFLADIQEFLKPLAEYYKSSPKNIKSKIYELGKGDINFCTAVSEGLNRNNNVNITIGRILKVFGKRSKSYLKTDLLPYLQVIGMIPAK